MNTADLRKQTGQRIKKIRSDLDIPRDYLAELLDISVGALGMIERGERGLTLCNLIKLSDVFSVSVDNILSRERKMPSLEMNNQHVKILGYVSNLTEDELNFVVDIMKSLHVLKLSRMGK